MHAQHWSLRHDWLAPVHAVVVGCGISGLTSALRLREAGCSVQIVAAQPPQQTTSAVAGALWYPYRALPQHEVTKWGAATFAVLAGLADQPATGVRMRSGRELSRVPAPEPWWSAAVPSLARVSASDLPAGYVDGFSLTVPVVDSSVHLPWLQGELAALGVAFAWTHVDDLATVAPGADVIVNCTGLGSAALLGDTSLVPVRGQIVVVEQIGLIEWLVDDSHGAGQPTYVVPRESTVVLGGTAETGATDLEPDSGTADGVHARCVALVPALAPARVLTHRVGLRPTRPAVRVTAERLPSGQPVVHNYGHGGSGWTLSYGCAAEVALLATTPV